MAVVVERLQVKYSLQLEAWKATMRSCDCDAVAPGPFLRLMEKYL